VGSNPLAAKCVKNAMTCEFDGAGGWLIVGVLPGLKFFCYFLSLICKFLKLFVVAVFLRK
jgi:hypothetical protein